MRVLIDGIPRVPETASISVFDWAVVRGDGCFEALRAYRGRAFAIDEHLARLWNSASALGMDDRLPPASTIAEWIAEVAQDGGDCLVRVLATRGGSDTHVDAPPRVIVYWEELPQSTASVRLAEIPAPWHPGGFPWELAGVKGLSYGPNMASRRKAKRLGFDDALLLSREGMMVEGPTFSVGWFVDGILETPSLDLGILASITRSVALEEAGKLGWKVYEGRFPVDRLDDAAEVFVLSTVREVLPVAAVGGRRFDPGPLTAELEAAFRNHVYTDLGL